MNIRPRTEIEQKWDALSDRQKEWVKSKARWEQVSTSRVLLDYEIPATEELCRHGANGCRECRVLLEALNALEEVRPLASSAVALPLLMPPSTPTRRSGVSG